MAEGFPQPDVQYNGSMGRPRLILEREKFEMLMDYGFKFTEIAEILNISLSTVNRRKVDFGLNVAYDVVLDHELDAIVKEYKQRTPETVGIGIVDGYIRSLGIKLLRSRERIAQCLQRIDEDGSQRRWHTAITRRVYSVPGPGSIWHLDGWHKLIRWGIVVHGGIDGYSRLATMIQASTNNRADTVFELFKVAVNNVHWPSRIRTDFGGENNLVGRAMLQRRGEGRGTWLRGSSVHNQRIERFWRDMRSFCANFFIDTFRRFEEERILDINCIQDMFALHATFIPILNGNLQEFKEVWNNHKLRTERKTPRQLFIQGILKLYHTDHTVIKDIVDGVQHVEDDFGVEPTNRRGNDNERTVHIQVPRYDLNLADAEKNTLLMKIAENVAVREDFRDKFICAKDTVETFINSRRT